MKHLQSPKSVLAWRCVMLSVLMLGLLAVLSAVKVGGVDQQPQVIRVLASIFLLVGWVAAIRFLLLDTWGRLFWLLVMIGALILTQFWGKVGLVLAIILSLTFMGTRMFMPWRLISPRRRAVGFGLGILALVVLFGSTGVWSTELDNRVLSGMDKLGLWSLGSLLVFWFLSLFHLAVRMRLHFLRLRAKLAVSAFLIGLVPLVLVVALGLLISFSALGGARILRATYILDSWRAMAHQGNDLVGIPFETTFVWPDASASVFDSTSGRILSPGWLPVMAEALGQDPDFSAQGDSTGWFLTDQELWLIRWQNLGRDDARASGWLLNEAPLVFLSDLLKVGVEFTEIQSFVSGNSIKMAPNEGIEDSGFQAQRACYRDLEGDPTYWSALRSYGVTFFPVNHLTDEGIEQGQLLLNLGVGWADLKADYLIMDNLNIVLVVMLALVAILFLTIEIFAFFFGVRISEGFVTAVHSLHKGTRALAKGELDTVIDIPNEDELGDLADSFNDMTVAIRQGRKDALAKEALTQELATAREIQERLLPSEEPALPGFEITGASIPSRQVGGDYFDFLIRDKDNIGVAIGDVSGKGMPAALLMSNLQASLHGQVIHPSSVAQVVGLVNDLIVASTDSHMFATFFYGQLNTAAGTFTSTNAGHNPPLVLRADGSLDFLKAGGLLLGMLPDQQYKQETVSLEPGDVVVLYTDGITEAVGPGVDEDDIDAMFGEEALEAVVRRSSHLPAVGIKEAILDAVSRHTEGVAQSDDITLVVIRRQG